MRPLFGRLSCFWGINRSEFRHYPMIDNNLRGGRNRRTPFPLPPPNDTARRRGSYWGTRRLRPGWGLRGGEEDAAEEWSPPHATREAWEIQPGRSCPTPPPPGGILGGGAVGVKSVRNIKMEHVASYLQIPYGRVSPTNKPQSVIFSIRVRKRRWPHHPQKNAVPRGNPREGDPRRDCVEAPRGRRKGGEGSYRDGGVSG